MKLSIKEWVCLVSDDVVQHRRDERRRQAPYDLPVPLKDHWWRQIEITGRPDGFTVSLMNVDQEAAQGGYWSCGSTCAAKRLTWDDLQDRECLHEFLKREQMVVFQHVQGMLERLREHALPLRRALAEV